MAEFKHPINMKVCELQADILRFTQHCDIIEIDVHSLLETMDSTTKPCSWQFWMDRYMDLVKDLVDAQIIAEPTDSSLWNNWLTKEDQV